MKLLIVNGPNLNRLGQREVAIYGKTSFEAYFESLKHKFSSHQLTYFQSNHEGDLIDQIQGAEEQYDGIVLNAGGYTHTSVAIRDAIAGISIPVIEVHISNIFSREEFRHTSYLAPVCLGTISGLGLNSYDLGIQAIIDHH